MQQNKHVKQIPMKLLAKSLRKEFLARDMKLQLDRVYYRTADMLSEYPLARGEQRKHLLDILPCIAFYEELIQHEGNREKAFATCKEWSLKEMEKTGTAIRRLMRFPGMYRLAPKIFDILIDRMYGIEAGFVSKRVDKQPGFARDTIVCPYLSACRKFGCPELARLFCDIDDICYKDMHPKLVWARTKTMARGGDCCDFRLYVDETKA